MASSFDRWEKDPFFSAAEQVQESADRMESTYRTWVHSKNEKSNLWSLDELRRDLRTALGTAKWQLEEFQRAAGSSYIRSCNEDSRDRHRNFIIAIGEQISDIERSIHERSLSEGKSPTSPWMRLDEGERDELALFLSGSSAFGEDQYRDDIKQQGMSEEWIADCLKSSEHGIEKPLGHRRTSSSSPNIGAWKIAIAEVKCPLDGSTQQPFRQLLKVPSFSGFLSSMEYVPKLKWPKNNARKWKEMAINRDSEIAPLQSLRLSNGIHGCRVKSKNCLDGCDGCCDKHLYNQYGAIQRPLRQPQYQIRYGRLVQVGILIVLFVCLVGLISLNTF